MTYSYNSGDGIRYIDPIDSQHRHFILSRYGHYPEDIGGIFISRNIVGGNAYILVQLIGIEINGDPVVCFREDEIMPDVQRSRSKKIDDLLE